MSLPLRFKAVCTETGRILNWPNCKANQTIDGFDLSPVDKQVICQSTGLTDSQGKEVFFGDVLSDEFGQIFEIKFYSRSPAFHLYNLNLDETDGIYRVCDMIVIGNRWEPIETLKQRAEAIANQ